MINNNNWFAILALLLSSFILSSKAHIIRIVILAALGLAGLWMIHTLAQDYHKISNNGGTSGDKYFQKRSTTADVIIVLF